MNQDFATQVAGKRPELIHLARRFVKTEYEADDLVQEVILRALMYADKYEPGTDMSAWLYTITRNTFINQYRQQVKSRCNVSITDIDHAMIDIGYYENDAISNLYQSEIIDDIEGIQLPDETVKSILKDRISGLKYKELASNYGMSMSQVKSRLYRGRAALSHLDEKSVIEKRRHAPRAETTEKIIKVLTELKKLSETEYRPVFLKEIAFTSGLCVEYVRSVVKSLRTAGYLKESADKKLKKSPAFNTLSAEDTYAIIRTTAFGGNKFPKQKK